MFEKYKQFGIIGVVILLVATAGYKIYSCGKSGGEIEKQRKIYMQSIDKAIAQKNNLPQLAEELDRLETQIVNFDAAIPAQGDLGGFLQQIADLMNRNKLANQLIQPEKEIELSETNCIAVNMQCTGQLQRIFDFFEELENMPRIVRFEKLALDSDRFSGNVNMKTRIYIYFSPKAG
ncbi:MAG: type 4a pilus biogenesis protein PilO [Phycisphaerae bacterium]|nr:type 4a pilus biogenesis protein PilO [Phycisphaerae bacterium]